MNPFITYAARSDMGRVRKNNKDNLYCAGNYILEESLNMPYKIKGKSDEASVFGIYDGMGGYQSDEKASLIASQLLLEFADKIFETSVLYSDEHI